MATTRLLLETGDALLLEDGGYILLDGPALVMKYTAEHASAYAAMGAAKGFAAEHAGALVDIGKAGQEWL